MPRRACVGVTPKQFRAGLRLARARKKRAVPRYRRDATCRKILGRDENG